MRMFERSGLFAAGALIVGGLAMSSGAAIAGPTLHGYCVAPEVCNDNGVVTPFTVSNPNFGFYNAGGLKGIGTFFLDVLIPNNVAGAASESFSISGTNTGIATASSNKIGDWTSGDLTKFLDRPADPKNGINAWLPTTQQYQPSANGYDVYDFSFGSVDWTKKKLYPTFSSAFSLPSGAIITAFFDTCGNASRSRGCWYSTANSGALANEDGPHPVPEPMTISLLGIGLLAAGGLRRRKKTA